MLSTYTVQVEAHSDHEVTLADVRRASDEDLTTMAFRYVRCAKTVRQAGARRAALKRAGITYSKKPVAPRCRRSGGGVMPLTPEQARLAADALVSYWRVPSFGH